MSPAARPKTPVRAAPTDLTIATRRMDPGGSPLPPVSPIRSPFSMRRSVFMSATLISPVPPANAERSRGALLFLGPAALIGASALALVLWPASRLRAGAMDALLAQQEAKGNVKLGPVESGEPAPEL